ncbi:unnamed protein product [Brachionus calyciflorus]|uniref:Uncharacterized protein n=1 Tax=Brachionus calyciflorus TaxID=104777 RepID=A0A814D2E7_9BILA|nr:unnamed protein product [Brachionus calyciflorus]
MDSARSRSEDISEDVRSEKADSQNSNSHKSELNKSISSKSLSQRNLSKRSNSENEHTEGNNHGHEQSQQHDLNEKTFNNDSDEKRSRRTSTASNTKISRPSSPLTSRSVNLQAGKKTRSQTNLDHILNKDPYLSSINDMKYLGDQFIIGKINPNLKSPFECKFEKRFQNTLKKLTNNPNKLDRNQILADYKRTKDLKVLLVPRFMLTNELKFTGDQFKVGKLDQKIQSPFEKRFQERFKSQLKMILPNPDRTSHLLKLSELKSIHDSLVIPRQSK